MSSSVERVVTSGTFSLDGGTWNVDNNVWIVGDDQQVYIIDAAHQAQPIIDQVGNRNVKGIICTHGHNDHITVAPQLAAHYDAPIYLHPEDDMLWQTVHPGVKYVPLTVPSSFTVGKDYCQMYILSTPGHSPGSICIYVPQLEVVFSGDTLFCGGPGATGRSYSDFPTIIASLKDSVLALPPQTRVCTGHGESTTIGDELPHLSEWIHRGY